MKTIIFCVQVLLIATLVLASSDSILMRDIEALTLRENEWTSFRRTKALPQLKCVGGDAQGQSNFFPKIVQCKNQGQDDRGIVQWKCDAEMDQRVRFGKITVSCEGYSRPGDPYVLRGSCGLEYELWLTDAGKQQQQGGRRRSGSRRGGFRSRHQQQQQQQREQRTYQQSYQEARYSTNTQPNADYGSWIGLAFVIVAILVLVYIFSGPSNGPTVVRATTTPNVNPQQPQQRIYPDVPSYNPEYVPTYDTPSSYSTYTAPTTTSNTSSWTTTAAGFGAGYLLGRATAPTTTQQQQPTEIHNHYHSDVYPEPSRHYESQSSDDDNDKQEYSTHTSHGYGDSNSR